MLTIYIFERFYTETATILPELFSQVKVMTSDILQGYIVTLMRDVKTFQGFADMIRDGRVKLFLV